jgi:serine/threonine protein kinase
MIGPYRPLERLGEGGMGVVYRAVAPSGATVAVKLIRPEFAADAEFRTRFAREVAASRRVSGHCTARLLDADTTGATPYLVTEFVDGPNLAQHVAANGPMHGGALRALAAGLAEALHAIHAAGLTHRDLKPGNVLLAPTGPKVIDFGIAATADSTAMTRSGTLLGSPGWLAPEQLEHGSKEPPVDVFAWGLLVAYAASGVNPYGEGRPDEVVYRVLHQGPDLRDVDPDLNAVVAAALARDPQERPTSDALLTALFDGAPADPAAAVTVLIAREWTRVLPAAVATQMSAVPPPHPPRHGWALAAVGAALIAVAAGSAIAFSPQHAVRPASSVNANRSSPTVTSTATTATTRATAPATNVRTPQAPTTSIRPPKTTAPPPTPSAPPAATQLTVFSPWDIGASHAHVVFSSTGTCWGSGLISRPDAYRCSTSSTEPNGGNVFDPCFVSPAGTQSYLLCSDDPKSNDVVRVRPTASPPPRQSYAEFDPATSIPWTLILSDGSKCVMLGGATLDLAGMRLNYGCVGPGRGAVYGDVNRAHDTWKVFYAPDKVRSPKLVAVREAIF